MNEIEVRFISYLQHDTKYIDRVQGKITALHLPHVYNVYRIINAYYKNHKSIIQEDYAIDFLTSHNYDNSIIMNYQETMVAICRYDHFDDAEFEEILLQLENKYKKSSLMNCLEEILDRMGKNNTIEETDSCIAFLRNTLSTIESEFRYTTFIEGKGVNKTVDYVGLCSALIKNLKIVKINGQLYNFNRYIKKYSSYEGENILIGELGNAFQQISTSKLNKLIPTQIHQETQEINGKYIAFKNVIYNAMSGEVKPRTPDDVVLNVIDFDLPDLTTYQPRKDVAETVDILFKGWSNNNPNIEFLLYQIIGAAMCRLKPQGELAKMFILTGLGNNGKSQFLNWVKAILVSNYSEVGLNDILDNDKFNKAPLENKICNIIDDATNATFKDASKLKTIVTGGALSGNKKYEDVRTIQLNNMTFINGCNEVAIIGSESDSNAILRRLVIVPFENCFNDKSSLTTEQNDILFNPLQYKEHLMYVIVKSLSAFKKALSNKQYNECKETKEQLKLYAERLNPIKEFVKELKFEDIINKSIAEVTQLYYQYEGKNSEPTKTDKSNIRRTILNEFKNLKIQSIRRDGKIIKCFVTDVTVIDEK